MPYIYSTIFPRFVVRTTDTLPWHSSPAKVSRRKKKCEKRIPNENGPSTTDKLHTDLVLITFSSKCNAIIHNRNVNVHNILFIRYIFEIHLFYFDRSDSPPKCFFCVYCWCAVVCGGSLCGCVRVCVCDWRGVQCAVIAPYCSFMIVIRYAAAQSCRFAF